MLFARTLLAFLSAAGAAAAQSEDLYLAIGMMNQARQAQGLQPLAWHPELATYAQLWGNQMATGQVPFGHAPGQMRPQQGETLYAEQPASCDPAYDAPLQTAAQSWLSEGAQWGGQPISNGQESWLHWSQIMWSTTTHIGCARSFGISNPYQFFSVCRFFPEGNM
ncbi:hypothetical protein N3K66_001316 [Trichothecium roseum]|uniref:Uncharacterized protein n=1 Tax=Trichothecium roseum TaxID=47278 RepID=A0ACC0VEI0_9HYPO|nr:hypothetical protein N3K66_001316 [Trichothecium roseum]